MIGRTTKERLINLIREAIVVQTVVYKRSVILRVKMAHLLTPEERKTILTPCAEEYYTAVANYVFEKVRQLSPEISDRVMQAAISDVCGYDIDLDWLVAGGVYAICFWAVTNEYADQNDCFELSDFQEEVRNEALIEAARALGLRVPGDEK